MMDQEPDAQGIKVKIKNYPLLTYVRIIATLTLSINNSIRTVYQTLDNIVLIASTLRILYTS